MNFQDFKENIIINSKDLKFGNEVDGYYYKVSLMMYYKPDMEQGNWVKGWIGEKTFMMDELKSMDIVEPYHQLWFGLKDRINSYYFNNFCNNNFCKG